MIKELLYLFWPSVCGACGRALLRKERGICFSCRHMLPRTNFHLHRDNPLEQLFWGRIPLAGAAAYYHFRKEGRVQSLLHELKYHNRPEIGEEIGRLYGRELRSSPVFSDSELVVPVPLHPAKQRLRGYNQSAEFGRGLSTELNSRLGGDVLLRVENSSTQTRKSRYERWENVERAFTLNPKEVVRGKKVLLVDDVITTGATLEGCGAVLLEAGVSRLSIACIAAPTGL